MMEENKNPENIHIGKTVISETPQADEAISAEEQAVATSPKQPEGQKILEGDTINLRIIIGVILSHKLLYFKILLATFIISLAYILCIPRTYSTVTRVAPEAEGGAEGMLGSIASSFGLNLGEAGGSDAIYPLLYPDLMEDNAFVSTLFDIQVTSVDGKINTTYYDYLEHYQLKPWWDKYIRVLKKLLPKDEPIVVKGAGNGGKGNEFNPYVLTKKQNDLVKKIRNTVGISCDKRTQVITIDVQMQDPLICKQVADSVRVRLQKYITVYRTEKARKDVVYYTNLVEESKLAYENARHQYGAFADANTDVELPSLRGRMEDLENDMQLKFNTFTAMNTQLLASKAKLQERTPAFTLLQGAAMPVKASGPKRMIFVIGMCMLAFIITTFWLIRKDMHFTF